MSIFTSLFSCNIILSFKLPKDSNQPVLRIEISSFSSLILYIILLIL